ncbi:damage-inducible protein DinB [Pelagovum pacificum]|uniref:Damage-inducible protein DinB n=2 Tax=Pelagovum pacificum TaxID=2588711 RepID=A0A5C5G8K8_9RHOB|nr:DinB family protein [Pelagovum pacificum]TNY31059.1 damage-inducible protein DinB [Pelagovum pacificum]
MARYNAWQNDSIRTTVAAMPDEELRRDRGAFFGSILGTLNHLLWADRRILARLQGASLPGGSPEGSADLTPNGAEWSTARFRADGRIRLWADSLTALDLTGTVTWGPGGTYPRALIVTHLFNHQTHHRGQVHAMLTAAGHATTATDLPLMPEK